MAKGVVIITRFISIVAALAVTVAVVCFPRLVAIICMPYRTAGWYAFYWE